MQNKKDFLIQSIYIIDKLNGNANSDKWDMLAPTSGSIPEDFIDKVNEAITFKNSGNSAELARFLSDFLYSYRDLLTDADFLNSLSLGEKDTLSNLLSIISGVSYCNDRLALIEDTLEYILDASGEKIVAVKDTSNSNNGALDPIYSAEKTFGNAEKIGNDPIVIDIGKSGFELTSQENGAHFDMDSNTLAEKTGWIRGDDAFLALDRNDGTKYFVF